MDMSWEDARLFLAVAEAGSVSAAARQLRISQPTVSRRLAALEYALGTKLFRRSAEGTALTAAGERLVLPARKMAEWAGELDRAARAGNSAPTGLVRITASPFACADFLAPFAGFVAQKRPGLRLEVLSTVQYLDLARGEADLALRSRAPTNADLQLLYTQEYEVQVYVSKALRARLPRRPQPNDVPWVAWAPPFDAVPPNPQLEQLMPGFVPAFTADNYLVLWAAVEAGVGAMAASNVRHRFWKDRGLVALDLDLGEFRHGRSHVVCAKSALDVPRVREVADLLVAELQRAKPG